MVRAYFVIALMFAMVAIVLAPPARAQPDPFAAGSGSAEGSAGSAAGSGATAPATTPGNEQPADAAAPAPSPACEYITKSICSSQNSGLLLKSGAYVVIAVLLFSLLRVWWDRRGTRTAGVRFVATLLPAAGTAGILAYLDPTRGQDLTCCLASSIFKSEILIQDSALARGALLGFVPAAVLFVLVAIILKIVKG
jgi:hypothetical protein